MLYAANCLSLFSASPEGRNRGYIPSKNVDYHDNNTIGIAIDYIEITSLVTRTHTSMHIHKTKKAKLPKERIPHSPV